MKMYFLVLYNLSPIQQGIQAGHCAIEYAWKYGSSAIYQDRYTNHKIFIILNGGTSITLQKHVEYLKKHGYIYATFEEPDLGGLTTCVCFLSDQENIEYFTNNFKLA